jgi:hypothetical protein
MFVSKFEDKIFSITKRLIKKSDFEARLDTIKLISFHRMKTLYRLLFFKDLV